MNGRLITFEGIDGSGKTTQAALLAERLRREEFPVRMLREPGGTPIGEKIRSVLLDTAHSDMQPVTELFLYLAARAQITGSLILPALLSGEHVIMDRFVDSTAAYQGYARGLGYDLVHELNLTATGGLIPDITFVFDCDPALAAGRLSSAPDRLEAEGIGFMRRVREGFLAVARREPGRVKIIDGSLPVVEIAEIVYTFASPLLSR
jgi:dTMP kinase